jgi:hypothetical protein
MDMLEFTIPPDIRAIFKEWALDFENAPPLLSPPDRTELVALYGALSHGSGVVLMPEETLASVLAYATLNRDVGILASIRDESRKVCEWVVTVRPELGRA